MKILGTAFLTLSAMVKASCSESAIVDDAGSSDITWDFPAYDLPSVDVRRTDAPTDGSSTRDIPASMDANVDGGVDPCRRNPSCRACTGNEMCGWCAGRCVSGTVSGPSSPALACTPGSWIWLARECP